MVDYGAAAVSSVAAALKLTTRVLPTINNPKNPTVIGVNFDRCPADAAGANADAKSMQAPLQSSTTIKIPKAQL